MSEPSTYDFPIPAEIHQFRQNWISKRPDDSVVKQYQGNWYAFDRSGIEGGKTREDAIARLEDFKKRFKWTYHMHASGIKMGFSMGGISSAPSPTPDLHEPPARQRIYTGI